MSIEKERVSVHKIFLVYFILVAVIVSMAAILMYARHEHYLTGASPE